MARWLLDKEPVRAVRLGLVPGQSGHRGGGRRRHRAAYPHLRLRQALRDQQHPSQRLRLRPARRGLRLGGRGVRRQPAPRHHRDLDGGRRARGADLPRLPERATRPPTPPSSTTSLRCWPARPSPVTGYAGQRRRAGFGGGGGAVGGERRAGPAGGRLMAGAPSSSPSSAPAASARSTPPTRRRTRRCG